MNRMHTKETVRTAKAPVVTLHVMSYGNRSVMSWKAPKEFLRYVAQWSWGETTFITFNVYYHAKKCGEPLS